ncbi:MAG: hypothetical protein KAX20_00425 [Candidatus Omnitrophica bacterium]|nr:hypothetical protein [Candidatus Omnitrophota bacterium]
MSTIVASERDALLVINELGVAKPEEIGKEMGFSSEYATVLCRSLWKNGYIRGTTMTGYEPTEKGKRLVKELKK